MRLAAFVAALLVGLCLQVSAREFRGAPAGDFDFYVLSLSWSPGFCASGGERRAPEQCASGAGFLVHGLWPQYEQGYPSYCGPSGRAPLRSDLDSVAGVMPSRDLARYEWRKHGSCSGLAPSQYFNAIAAVRARLNLPKSMADKAAPLDIERGVAAANPGLRTDMVAVACGRSEEGETVLQEIRLCMSKDLRNFRTCPAEIERGGCRSRSIDIPAPR